MTDKVKVKFDNESLAKLLRTNISCHMNKILTQEIIEQITAQIIESLEYFVNKNEN